MEKVRLTFFGTSRSETDDNQLECFANVKNEIYLSIKGDVFESICLDRQTAIKFHKELKKQISFLDNEPF